MGPLVRILRLVFYLLYHPLAWSYDIVAWTVSLGRWKDWVKSVAPFIRGTKVLELGYGPGHLQRFLHSQSLYPFGLDESRQMGQLAKKRLSQYPFKLIRGAGQNLPFANHAFDSIVATFPAEYIFETHTLAEILRTLSKGGRLVLLPIAWITGKGIHERLAAWLFQVTGQAPNHLSAQMTDHLLKPFREAGYTVSTEIIEIRSSRVLIVIAET